MIVNIKPKNPLTMKNLHAILIALLVLGIAACSTNNDNKLHLTGKWKFTNIEFNYSGTMTVDGQTQPVNVTTHATNLDGDDYVILSKDHSFTSSLNDVVMKMTSKSGDQTITERDTLANGAVFSNGTWAKSGDTLTITENDGTTTKLKISNLAHSNLTLTTDTLSLGLENTNIKVTMTLKR
jgi:hypothetical protein